MIIPLNTNKINSSRYKDYNDTSNYLPLSFICNYIHLTFTFTQKGLNEYYTISTNISSFEESVRPLNNLNKFANVFLLLVLIIGGIILVVLNMINIRERKYEVGVLRAIGMKNSKVLLQFITEFFAVTFLALILGSVIGSVLSVPSANMMLQNEIKALEEKEEEVFANFGRNGQNRSAGFGGGFNRGNLFITNQNVSYVSQINAIINPIVILQMILIGIILTLISSSISVILISRYEPLKILSNRS